jgi:phosphoribosylformimino-5-aminoimidazole carboxamide ribotide isomerase
LADLVILLPAIDIRGGRAVRLVQGDYEQETAYDNDPLDAALRWIREGATWLHVVDLDGARAGEARNLDYLARIAAAADVPVQFGGGLRDSRAVKAALDAGAERCVLGTAALRDPDLIEALVGAHGERIVAGVDARRGKVAVEGWTEEGEAGPVELVASLARRGVRQFVYTPVEVDGMLAGPSMDEIEPIAAATGGGELIYSGGVGSVDDLRALAALGIDALTGVIVGRALYEGRLSIAEGQAALADRA